MITLVKQVQPKDVDLKTRLNCGRNEKKIP